MTSLVASTKEPVWDCFFQCDRPAGMEGLDPFLTPDPAGVVAGFAVGTDNAFGPVEWKKYFGLDVGAASKLPKEFYTWWYGPDPVDPIKQCCETHLPPVYRPAGMSLKKLGELVAKPLEGHASQ